LNSFSKLVDNVGRMYATSEDFTRVGVMEPRYRHDFLHTFSEVVEKEIRRFSPMELASIIGSIPNLEDLEVGTEFYGAPALFMLQAIVSSAVDRAFSNAFDLLRDGDPTFAALKSAVDKVVAEHETSAEERRTVSKGL
jgi:hypothetical protein